MRPFLFLIFIVVAWDLSIRLFKIPAYQIPAPADVVAVLWQDWMVYGPMSGTRRIFAAVAAATAILATMAWEEGAPLPTDPHHPLNLHFPQEVAMMTGEMEGKSDRVYKKQKEKRQTTGTSASS